MLCYENKPRMRICFDPEHEIPKLQSWFAENNHPSRLQVRAANDPSVFTITEKVLTGAFSWLKAPTSALTLKILLRHYAKQALTQ